MNSDEAAKILADIFRETILLSHSLPLEVSLNTDPQLAKVTWKYLRYREALLWRSEELAKAGRNELLENRVISSTILARALLECAAGFHYLSVQISKALKDKNSEDLDTIAMRLLMGSKWKDWEHEPINVLTLIDHLDRQYVGVRHFYDSLSEYAHPNWSGTAGSYSALDRKALVTRFGAYFGNNGHLFQTCSVALATALPIISKAYNDCTDMFPEFNAFCTEAFDKDA